MKYLLTEEEYSKIKTDNEDSLKYLGQRHQAEKNKLLVYAYKAVNCWQDKSSDEKNHMSCYCDDCQLGEEKLCARYKDYSK